MPSTTNFGWTTPADTDLVKDGAAAIRTLGNGIDTSFLDLKGGTSGQVLAKNSNTDLDFVWVAQDDSNAIQNAIVDAKGDLISATAADTPARLAVGANNTVLTADSSTSTGLKWAAPASASGPTFRAYLGSVQNPSANTLTKVVFDTESWDTDACYDPTTNYRFTPNKAGYYMVNLALTMTADPLNKPNISIIYKNGAQYENLYIGAPMVTTSECLASAATIINFNGTTDYIEAYYYSEAGTSRSIVQGSINTHFSAVWIRS